MLKFFLSLLIIFLAMGSSTAQTFIGRLNPFPDNPRNTAQPDTVRILAAMVNFAEDRDGATFGNGKFGSIYSTDYGSSILDPLPHNRAYFESHLEFVKNYFQKVSNGKTIITYTVLPDTFSVSQTMRNYSPPPNSNDFSAVGNFAQEVWTLADALYPGFNFGEYNLFTIFHAGVGRDITLPGSLGNERDLPSIYLGPNALENIFGQGFAGFPVSNNSFRIPNSMIIPETESREVQSLGGTVLFEVSINGLLAASVCSYLGLPDLFDTETGLSAIGRFGLMDGQAIFAYSGIFPPEPSAWEKIFLGWAEPVTIEPGIYNITLAAKLEASLSDTTILKVPVNSSEYYLVENRIRDVNNDGALITFNIGESTFTKTFLNDTSGFYSFSVDSVDGVVTDVDEFDWAIPNSISVEDNAYNPKPGGGIVIWHIDEKIINDKIAENKINADKNNRGIDVEEADGVQDIGETFFTVFGDQIIGEGFIEDFWYASNPGEFFENRFSSETRPNTNTNSGANSLVAFSGFSEIGNRMSFNLVYGDSIIKPVSFFQFDPDGTIQTLSHLSGLSFGSATDSGFIIMSPDTVKVFPGIFSDFKPAHYRNNETNYLIGASAGGINVYNSSTELVTGYLLSSGENITAAPVIRQSDNEPGQLLIGTSEGRVLIYSLTDISSTGILPIDSVDYANSPIRKITGGNILAFTTDSSFFIPSAIPETAQAKESSLNENLNSLIKDFVYDMHFPVILAEDNNFFVRDNSGTIFQFRVPAEGEINSFSMADLKNDGSNYILFSNGTKLEAVNPRGAAAENFPFIDPMGIGFSATPLAADFEGDSKAEVIACTKDGRIFALDGGTGRLVNGFPLSAGAEIISTPVLFIYEGQTSLAAVDAENNFHVWKIGPNEGKLFWSEENGNKKNSSLADPASVTNRTNEFFPGNKVYNYPNPVYEGQTYIRYYVSEDSRINIKIFDLAGDFVAELNDNALGGLENETTWDVSSIQSGVYLARVEATGSSGISRNSIIKIAVIK